MQTGTVSPRKCRDSCVLSQESTEVNPRNVTQACWIGFSPSPLHKLYRHSCFWKTHGDESMRPYLTVTILFDVVLVLVPLLLVVLSLSLVCSQYHPLFGCGEKKQWRYKDLTSKYIYWEAAVWFSYDSTSFERGQSLKTLQKKSESKKYGCCLRVDMHTLNKYVNFVQYPRWFFVLLLHILFENCTFFAQFFSFRCYICSCMCTI